MITEQDQEKLEIEEIKKRIDGCEQAIAKAEKYERLADNSDWKGFWQDVRVAASLHEREIQMAISTLLDAPNTSYFKGTQVVSSKSDWTDYIIRHEIQRDELLQWAKEPGFILELARQARNALPGFKEKLVGLESHAEPTTTGTTVRP